MAIGSGSDHTVHYVQETVYGETPATPAWKELPILSDSIALTKDGIEDETLRADRQVSDYRGGVSKVAGDTPGNLDFNSFDDILEAGFMGTWASDVLTPGTVRRSFSLEKYFNLATDEYHRVVGCEVNSLAFSIQPNGFVSVTPSWVGADLTTHTTKITGATYTSVAKGQAFDSYTGKFEEGGVVSGAVTGLDFTLENGIEPANILFNKVGICGSAEKSRVSGTASFYFLSSREYNKFLNDEDTTLEVELEDPAGNKFVITLPRVTYTSGNPEVGGSGQITISLDFMAQYDVTDDTQITITKV